MIAYNIYSKYMYRLRTSFDCRQVPVNCGMDNTLLLLMLTACFCGSIKNKINLPDEFEERLAKAVEPKRQYPKTFPYDIGKYRNIVSNKNNDVKGNNIARDISSLPERF